MSPHAMSPSAVVDARSENAPKLTSNNVIRSEDIAKIRKDAEIAIENEFKILNHTKLPVLIPSNHRGYKTSGARLKEDCLLFFASADEFSSAFAWKFEEELLSLPSDNS